MRCAADMFLLQQTAGAGQIVGFPRPIRGDSLNPVKKSTTGHSSAHIEALEEGPNFMRYDLARCTLVLAVDADKRKVKVMHRQVGTDDRKHHAKVSSDISRRPQIRL